MIRQLIKSKCSSALIGTGLGDTPGAPLAGRLRVTPQKVEIMVERRAVLTYTDGSHMMVGLAESPIRTDGFDGGDMMRMQVSSLGNTRSITIWLALIPSWRNKKETNSPRYLKLRRDF